MSKKQFSRLPNHVGLIPDGNRRWAKQRGLHPAEGYFEGVMAGLRMLDECLEIGIREVSVYGFTMDNTKRPKDQTEAFSLACVKFVEAAMSRSISLKVIGDHTSKTFPQPLTDFAISRQGEGDLKVNLLVNYGWNWDIQTAVSRSSETGETRPFLQLLASHDVSRVDLLVRWGGMRRLSGFLPIQTAYTDIYVVDEYWPDYQEEQFHAALTWYSKQDVTLGG